MAEDKSNIKKRTILGPLLIFFIPVYGYVLLFAYEAGYYSFLRIPIDFVEINFSRLAYICGFLFIGFTIFVGAADIIYAFKIHKTVIGRKTLIYLYLLFVMVILPMIIFDYLEKWLPWIIGSTVLYIISDFVFPIISNKKIKGYKNKIEQQAIKEVKANEGDFLDVVIKRIGYSFYLGIFFLLSLTYIAFLTGALSAKTQKSYLVIDSDPELIVIRKYSQDFICSEFDREKKLLLNIFRIETINQISEMELTIRSENIGPLKASNK